MTAPAAPADRTRGEGLAFTDEQLLALAEALDSFAVGQVQGFHYGSRLVIRDCLRKPGNQVIWEGPDTDREAFERQCRIEHMRVAVALWLTKAATAGRRALADAEMRREP